jgi:hypothetical protein
VPHFGTRLIQREASLCGWGRLLLASRTLGKARVLGSLVASPTGRMVRRHRLRGRWTSEKRSTLMSDQFTFVKSSLMNVMNSGAAQRGGNTGGLTLASLKKSSLTASAPSALRSNARY